MEIGKIDLPDGKYNAIWSGYNIEINGKEYPTIVGVKGMFCATKIKIEDSKAFVI